MVLEKELKTIVARVIMSVGVLVKESLYKEGWRKNNSCIGEASWSYSCLYLGNCFEVNYFVVFIKLKSFCSLAWRVETYRYCLFVSWESRDALYNCVVEKEQGIYCYCYCSLWHHGILNCSSFFRVCMRSSLIGSPHLVHIENKSLEISFAAICIWCRVQRWLKFFTPIMKSRVIERAHTLVLDITMPSSRNVERVVGV